MKRISLCLFAGTILFAGVAQAGEIKVGSKVGQVTVYPAGATATRIMQIELPAGASTIIAVDFPVGLDPRSLRVAGHGDVGLQIGAVDSRLIKPSPDPDLIHQTERQIRALQDDIGQLDGEIAAAEAQKRFLDTVVRNMTRPTGGEDKGSPIDPAAWTTAFEMVGKGHAQSHRIIHEARMKQRDLKSRIEALRQEMTRDPSRRQTKREVRIAVNAASAGSGELSVTYQIAGAGWAPVYAARLLPDMDKPSFELTRRALVRQRTGEDWSNVALILSTTRPRGATAAPELPSLLAALVKPVPSRPNASFAAKAPATEADRLVDDGLVRNLAPKKADEKRKELGVVLQMAQLNLAGFNATYAIPGTVSLNSGRDTKTVTISAASVKAELIVRAVPAIDTGAYLHAMFKHDGEAPLLPGRVSLYRDKVYVGTGQLPLIAKGEKAELGFGADDRVKIKRVETNRNTGERGLLSSSRIDERAYKITVENNHDRAMRIAVLDRMPYAQNEDIEITVGDITTKPTSKNTKDKRGHLIWDYSYKPGEKKTMALAYQISWPQGQSMRLSNRR